MNNLKPNIQAAFFWLALFSFLFFTGNFKPMGDWDKFRLAFFATNSFIVLHYTNSFLLKRFFETKQIRNYAISIIILIVVIAFAVYSIISTIATHDEVPFFAAIINVIMPVILSSGYYFSRKGFQTEIALNELQAKQLEAEMQLLKMQIQPHFLFNTLNNIYATNLTQHTAANEMILQLSEILRFQLESHKKQFIKLSEEIEIIENYVALEKVRLHDCKVSVTKTGDFQYAFILSMLLLPLIENAFKYGKNRIDIALSMDKNTFVFECENEIVGNASHKYSGKIGLKNVEKRLALIYTDRYAFSAMEKEYNVFAVRLEIEL
jgi:two-component system, LytTR family, sensor kinase